MLLTVDLNPKCRIEFLLSGLLSVSRHFHELMQLVINLISIVYLILRFPDHSAFELNFFYFILVKLHLSLIFTSSIGPQLKGNFLVSFVQNFHFLRSVQEIFGVFRNISGKFGKVNEILMDVGFHVSEGMSFMILF